MKALPKYTLTKDQLEQRLSLIIGMIKEALDKFEITEDVNQYEDMRMRELLHSFGEGIGTLNEAHKVITDGKYLSSIIDKISSQELYDPTALSKPIDGFSHLCNVEMLKIAKDEVINWYESFLSRYEKSLPAMNKTEVFILNTILETTAYYLFAACCDNRNKCDHNTLNNTLMYFDYKNHISPKQETIMFSSVKNILIVYHCEGQKKAVKEFVDTYCPNVQAQYFNDLDGKILSVKADMALYLESTAGEYADQVSRNGIPCYANIMQEYALYTFSDSIIQFDGTYDLDTIFEYLAAVMK